MMYGVRVLQTALIFLLRKQTHDLFLVICLVELETGENGNKLGEEGRQV